MIKILCLSIVLLGIFAGAASGHEHWNQGSSEDWLGVGPIYPYGSYYYPIYYETAYYWNDYPYYWNWDNYPIYYPIYNTYYHPHYPRYFNDFDHFPLGTFGQLRGGNY